MRNSSLSEEEETCFRLKVYFYNEFDSHEFSRIEMKFHLRKVGLEMISSSMSFYSKTVLIFLKYKA